MRVNRYNFLFVIGLVLTLGVSAAVANGDKDRKKPPKGMGTLNVKTTIVNPTPSVSFKVYVDGVERTETDIYLSEGEHTVKVTTSDGEVWDKKINIRRGKRECICLKIITRTKCPYRFEIQGPKTFKEGETVTFNARNLGTGAAPTSYNWVVSPKTAADSLTGQGTSSITISSEGLAGQKIRAELDVNDDNYVRDDRCTADKEVEVKVGFESCPYRFAVVPSAVSISQGEEVTFTYEKLENSPTPSQYNWKVTTDGARIIRGENTSSITVSSEGIVGQEIRVELDTNDNNYDYSDQCKADAPVRLEPPETAYYLYSWDAQKAFLDIEAIGLNQKPNHSLHFLIYPGKDKASRTLFTYRRVYDQIYRYLTPTVDRSRITINEGETIEGRTYVRIQVVPPGRGPKPFEGPPGPGKRPPTVY